MSPVKTPAPAPPGLHARIVATKVVARVLNRRQTLNASFDAVGMLDDPRDRALARLIATTALRHHGELTYALSRLLERPLDRKARTVSPLLLTGLAQILFTDIKPHATVDLCVRQAAAERATRHYRGLVNAVLRSAVRRKSDLAGGDAGACRNIPPWLFRRWQANYGTERTARFASTLLRPPSLDISVKDDAASWAKRLGGQVVADRSVRLVDQGAIDKLAGFDDGHWWVQDIAAAMPVRVLGPVSGKHVLDLCAAPGGKTAQLATMGARVTAVDRSKRRVERLRDNMKRLGLSVDIAVSDAETFRPDAPPDMILLDAPCSATGTIRRSPDLMHIKTARDIESLADLQSRLLRHAASLLPPGGILVYCTCSLEPEEGEQQIETFLEADPRFRRAPIGMDDCPGFEDAITRDGDMRILPDMPKALFGSADHRLAGSTGFFISRVVYGHR